MAEPAARGPAPWKRRATFAIPKPVRDRLGIEPGSAVEFEMAPDGRVVLVKVDAAPVASRFEGLRGCAGHGLSTDQIMALTRGER